MRRNATEELRHFVHGPDGGRQSDALQRTARQRFQPFQRQRQVRASLGRRQRVNLVDDHRGDAGERVTCPGRQHQVQGFRRRDQDVAGRLREARALG